MREMEKREKKEARKEKDSHICSKIKDTRLHNTQRGRLCLKVYGHFHTN